MRPLQYVKNGAHDLIARVDRAIEAGEIDEAEWHRQVSVVITPAYLAGDNPRSQSGYSRDDVDWTHARGLIADAIDRSGTFLDIGCASGYLMECMQRWCAAKGITIEPYGLDIAPELAELAQRRLPHWSDRIWVGNAINWRPPMQFEFVRTGLYVPRPRRRDLVEHLLQHVVRPGGRLIIGTENEDREPNPEDPTTEQLVLSWGMRLAGRSERPHRDPRVCYRVIWVDAKAC